MTKKKKEKKIEKICDFCNSYSRFSATNGWCMRLRKGTKAKNYCGEWN